MKKLTILIISAALACMAVLALSACGQQDGGSSSSAASSSAASGSSASASSSQASPFATLGDVFAAETNSMSSTYDEQRYVCAFSLDGAWWRVEAALEDGMYDRVDKVWAEDQTKAEDLLAPLAVTKAETLEAPGEDSLKAYVGKTGADLTADGFEFSTGTLVVNGDETDCVAAKDGFDCLVTFDGKVKDENTDDPAGAVAGLTVSAVSIQGVSWSVIEG